MTCRQKCEVVSRLFGDLLLSHILQGFSLIIHEPFYLNLTSRKTYDQVNIIKNEQYAKLIKKNRISSSQVNQYPACPVAVAEPCSYTRWEIFRLQAPKFGSQLPPASMEVVHLPLCPGFCSIFPSSSSIKYPAPEGTTLEPFFSLHLSPLSFWRHYILF